MFQSRHRRTTLIFTTLTLLPLVTQAQSATRTTPAQALSATSSAGPNSFGSDPGNGVTKFASGPGTLIYLGAGTLLPMLEDGPDGKEQSLRTADSLLSSTLISATLKNIVHEKRPDSSARNSFPSGHATAAFAIATVQSHFHPHQSILWYGGASLIAYSRVNLNRHYWQDVIAGAAIGSLTSRLELSRPHGLILTPFIRPHQEGGGSGMSMTMNF